MSIMKKNKTRFTGCTKVTKIFNYNICIMHWPTYFHLWLNKFATHSHTYTGWLFATGQWQWNLRITFFGTNPI